MNKDKLQKIHDSTMKILEKTGMKFHHPQAVDILKKNGIRVDGNVVYFTEDQLLYWVRKAPSRFTLYARNPEHNIVIGGDVSNVAPCYGPASIIEKDGTKRDGTIADYVNYVKLFHANDDYHVDGGMMIQPNDIDIPTSSMAMFYATLTHSDKAMMIPTGQKEHIEAMIECAAAVFGGKEALRAYPRMLTIMNINTPLQLDVSMADVLLTLAKNGQPFVAANCAMAGTTSPITLAGTMALTNAEVLSCIALTQMVNPGTPVVYASQSTTSDMSTGQIACGSPEGALCYKYTAQLAKFYGLPCRGGGSVTDSKLVDAQAGYESMLTLMADFSNNMNMIIHSAGILDGYNATSYEKLIHDFEIVRYVKRYFRDIAVNDDTIPLDVIHEVGHDGEYLTQEHTFDYCRIEPLNPTISTRGNVDDPLHQMGRRIEDRLNQMMASYTQPELDAGVLEEVREILENHGLSRELMERIQQM